MKTEEDEAFEEVERKQRAQAALDKMAQNARELGLTYDDDTLCYRNDVIEEVAVAIEQFRIPFAADTVASFAAFIREMKR